MENQRYFPAPEEGRTTIELPAIEVTLLEDRAQVVRRARIEVTGGLNRLLIADVAPVIQDVSLQAVVHAGAAKLADIRARRAMRIKSAHKPEELRRIDEEIEQIRGAFSALADQRQRAASKRTRLGEVLEKGAREIPEDAAWGMVNVQAWRDTFETLMKRTRELEQEEMRAYFQQQRLARKIDHAAERRRTLDRPDMQFVAWLELDLLATSPGPVEISVAYVVPNAIWRPLHSARLDQHGRLEWTSSAAVWQNTGEDWKNVELLFSTARSSLGTEPPLLADDLLNAQRRSEEIVVQARQVAIQKATVGGPATIAAPSSTVELPGVDDGGEVRTLRSAGKCSVVSDGRPNVVPLLSFDAQAETTLVLIPEIDDKVFSKASLLNGSKAPILAGPVELIRDNGVVGWTKVLFVAPGERFELGFGPDDAVRVSRQAQRASDVDPIDRWKVTANLVRVYLSHLGGETKTIEVVERIPVSEIEHVRVMLLAERTQPVPVVDDNGFCTWRVPLAPMEQRRIQLAYSVASAPTVQGI
jgi:uncharacterized protein (TIGR02231 family)